MVAAAYSKRRRKDCQPIRADLAAMLRDWLAGKAATGRVFALLPNDTARMLRADLKAARQAWIDEAAEGSPERRQREQSDFLKYQNAAGEIADFHSTRHTYISVIVNSGANVKTAQELARHSTPVLTIGKYAHARKKDLSEALNALPAENSVKLLAQQLGRETVQNSAIAYDETSLLKSAISAATSSEVQTGSEVMRASAIQDEKRRWSELNRRWRICNPLP